MANEGSNTTVLLAAGALLAVGVVLSLKKPEPPVPPVRPGDVVPVSITLTAEDPDGD